MAIVTPVVKHWLEWEIAQWLIKQNQLKKALLQICATFYILLQSCKYNR